VARLLAVDEEFVRQLAQTGEIPSLAIGGAIRFRPDAIRRWLDVLEAQPLEDVVLPPASDETRPTALPDDRYTATAEENSR